MKKNRPRRAARQRPLPEPPPHGDRRPPPPLPAPLAALAGGAAGRDGLRDATARGHGPEPPHLPPARPVRADAGRADHQHHADPGRGRRGPGPAAASGRQEPCAMGKPLTVTDLGGAQVRRAWRANGTDAWLIELGNYLQLNNVDHDSSSPMVPPNTLRSGKNMSIWSASLIRRPLLHHATLLFLILLAPSLRSAMASEAAPTSSSTPNTGAGSAPSTGSSGGKSQSPNEKKPPDKPSTASLQGPASAMARSAAARC